jgi:hypothetical protein
MGLGDVRCPQILGAWTPVVDPLRDSVEYVSAHPPMFQIFGAAHGELPSTGGLSGGKDVVGCAVFCD